MSHAQSDMLRPLRFSCSTTMRECPDFGGPTFCAMMRSRYQPHRSRSPTAASQPPTTQHHAQTFRPRTCPHKAVSKIAVELQPRPGPTSRNSVSCGGGRSASRHVRRAPLGGRRRRRGRGGGAGAAIRGGGGGGAAIRCGGGGGALTRGGGGALTRGGGGDGAAIRGAAVVVRTRRGGGGGGALTRGGGGGAAAQSAAAGGDEPPAGAPGGGLGAGGHRPVAACRHRTEAAEAEPRHRSRP